MRKFLLLVVGLVGCARNVEFVKEHSRERWAELGYETIAYEGYQWSVSGGYVWHLLKRSDTPGMIYSGYLEKWGDEIQVYGPTPVNQVKIVQ